MEEDFVEKKTIESVPFGRSSRDSLMIGIDLHEVWRILIRQWKILVCITMLFTAVSLVVSFLEPDIYRVEATLLPPLESDFGSLNIPGIYTADSNDLFTFMVVNLRSRIVQKKFVDEQSLRSELNGPKHPEDRMQQLPLTTFNEELRVKEIFKQRKIIGAVSLSLEGHDAELIASWLNDFVEMTDAVTARYVKDNIKAKIDTNADELQIKINSIRVLAEQRRLDRLTRLSEAILIAEKIGLEGFVNVNFYSLNQSENGANTVERYQEYPEYLKGTEILRAEVATLKNRKDNDPYVPELRELQEQLSVIKNIDLENRVAHAMRFDKKAVANNSLISPNRILIVFLGFLAGILISVISVIAINLLMPIKD